MATYDIFCQVGQSIGMIRKDGNRNGPYHYWLAASDIRMISLTESRVRVFTEAFSPVDDYKVRFATEEILNGCHVLAFVPFLLTDEVREKVLKWIHLENEIPLLTSKSPD